MGDLGRWGYYLYKKLPYQFIAGGGFALFMDILVLLQFCLYRNNGDLEEVEDSGFDRVEEDNKLEDASHSTIED